jgi:hypothetical protein
MRVPESADLYRYLVGELAKLDLAFVHVLHIGDEDLLRDIRAAFPNTLLVLRAGRAREDVAVDVEAGLADIAPIASWALANPDVVERLRRVQSSMRATRQRTTVAVPPVTPTTPSGDCRQVIPKRTHGRGGAGDAYRWWRPRPLHPLVFTRLSCPAEYRSRDASAANVLTGRVLPSPSTPSGAPARGMRRLTAWTWPACCAAQLHRIRTTNQRQANREPL